MKTTETTPQETLLAPYRAGAQQNPLREIFELLADYIVRAVGAYLVALALTEITLRGFPAVSQHPKGVIGGFLISFVVVLLAFTLWLDGGQRRERFRRAIATFAYPIILIAGLWGGYRYCEYVTPQTEQGRQYKAALSACMEIQTCSRLMEEKAAYLQ
ncbi:hypothetical protein FHX15_000927 [Rhizobium sp. BK650]|uniref:hypothetical protein n=1 Tax=Rhizobium sp. BK650 TaxID=2586990 RepID=UPI0016152093|nr:hypothetical protein [Rhizobium sp. BK650]MBB3655714.1 hypothetical protein [Rhizobium sp. BK650]